MGLCVLCGALSVVCTRATAKRWCALCFESKQVQIMFSSTFIFQFSRHSDGHSVLSHSLTASIIFVHSPSSRWLSHLRHARWRWNENDKILLLTILIAFTHPLFGYWRFTLTIHCCTQNTRFTVWWIIVIVGAWMFLSAKIICSQRIQSNEFHSIIIEFHCRPHSLCVPIHRLMFNLSSCKGKDDLIIFIWRKSRKNVEKLSLRTDNWSAINAFINNLFIYGNCMAESKSSSMRYSPGKICMKILH